MVPHPQQVYSILWLRLWIWTSVSHFHRDNQLKSYQVCLMHPICFFPLRHLPANLWLELIHQVPFSCFPHSYHLWPTLHHPCFAHRICPKSTWATLLVSLGFHHHLHKYVSCFWWYFHAAFTSFLHCILCLSRATPCRMEWQYAFPKIAFLTFYLWEVFCQLFPLL